MEQESIVPDQNGRPFFARSANTTRRRNEERLLALTMEPRNRVPEGDAMATSADLGLTRKQIHEARTIRDAAP